ncbi:MAG: T9SS type A sorting domain-containing protein [Bacteroidales bacterium]
MKRFLLSLSMLLIVCQGWAQGEETVYHAEDLKALETFVKAHPDYEHFVNYWEDMVYLENVGFSDKFGVTWSESDGVKRITKFQINNTIDDDKEFGSIDLNAFTALENITIKSANITSVNASDLTDVNYVEIRNTNVTNIDLPRSIETLYLYNNSEYSNGDLSQYTELTYLFIGNMPLNSLTIGSDSITTLTVFDLPIKNLDLSITKDELIRVSISRCEIEAFDFDAYPNMIELTLDGCGLTTLPISNLVNELTLYVSDNNLSHLDLTDHPKVKSITAQNSNIERVSFSENSTSLGLINLTNNNIETLDIRNWNFDASGMNILRVGNNPLKEITPHDNIKTLVVANCKLTSLDMSKCSLLSSLDCKYNQLDFHTVKTPKYNFRYTLSPQDSIKVSNENNALVAGDIIDLSAYTSPEDGVTGFEWYIFVNGKATKTDKIAATEDFGKFIMPQGEYGRYYCKITTTSPLIKNMYLATEAFDLTEATSVSEHESSISISPNPVKDILTIKGCDSDNISIFNTVGELIHSIKAEREIVTLNTSSWIKGVYFVKVNNNTYKLIKN